MKKLLLLSSLIFPLLLLNSCVNHAVVKPTQQSSDIQKAKLPLAIKDYFFFEENTEYVYEGKGNEYAAFSATVDYITENRVQLRSNNGGTERVNVLENKDGRMAMLLSRGECYYRENLTNSPSTYEEILLMEPLIEGTTWTLSDNRKRYISNAQAEVTTSLGKLNALEVTTVGKEDKTIDYYAPNVGLVKTVFISNSEEISSSLSKIVKNTSLVQTVKFYYPNADTNKLYTVNKQLSFHTNDITRILFEKAFKDIPKADLGKVLSTNVKIKSLYLNKDNIIYVDFTKDLVLEMNAGAAYEEMILQSIVNTLGGYYGTGSVYITIEGSPYNSGHTSMKKGEFFTVNLNNCVE